MLDITELVELEEEIRAELDENLTGILAKLNRSEQLEDLLSLLSLEHLLKKDVRVQTYGTGKILVIGESMVKADAILAIGKSLGIEKDRFRLHLGYEAAVHFDFKEVQWDLDYSVILVGPMPHSGIAKGDAGSIISAIEKENGYPPVVRLGRNGLKITKTYLKETLEGLLQAGTLQISK